MSEQHTDEWTVVPDVEAGSWDLVSNNGTVCTTRNAFLAYRIAATMNVCAGIPTKALEDGVLGELIGVVETTVRMWNSLDVHNGGAKCSQSKSSGTPKICVACEMAVTLAKLKETA